MTIIQRIENTTVGENVSISEYTNIYGCCIGSNTKIGPFVEIQKDVKIGKNCKISSHSFICTGVEIGDDVFIGHNVCFTNDKYPRSVNQYGIMKKESDWTLCKTIVEKGASIGSGSTILCGLTIGEGSMVGAGSVVVKDVPPDAVVVGNPARVIRRDE